MYSKLFIKWPMLRSVSVILAFMVSWPLGALAEEYPTGPITMVVPAPPGGGTDTLGRMVADGISEQLGQPVVVENRGGASGMIAANAVLDEPADGYTVFMTYSGVLSVNHALYDNIEYDPVEDFSGVANFAEVPNVLIVHPSVEATSVEDVIELAKANPGELTYASSGNGVSNHLAMELFKQMAGLEIRHVPYKGGAPAMTDLLGGRVDLMFNNLVEVQPHIESKGVRPIAIATSSRSETLPDLPTVSETRGLEDYAVELWYGVVVRAGTPQPIIDKLNAAITAHQKDPEVVAALSKRGARPVFKTPSEFDTYIESEVEKWGNVIREAGITRN